MGLVIPNRYIQCAINHHPAGHAGIIPGKLEICGKKYASCFHQGQGLLMERIAIIGAGLMGHGLALVFARAGHRVTATDPVAQARDSLKDRVAATLRPWVRTPLRWNWSKWRQPWPKPRPTPMS